jgi:hypothetical protein
MPSTRRIHRSRFALAILLAAAAMVMAGCGDGQDEASGTAPAPPGSSSPPAPPASQPTADQPDCRAATLLPVLQELMDDDSIKLHVVRAEVRRCRQGYALVWAVPDRSVCDPGVGYCYETEPVFLHWGQGRWKVLFTGTGISCEGETNAEVAAVCRKLGYPG